MVSVFDVDVDAAMANMEEVYVPRSYCLWRRAVVILAGR